MLKYCSACRTFEIVLLRVFSATRCQYCDWKILAIRKNSQNMLKIFSFRNLDGITRSLQLPSHFKKRWVLLLQDSNVCTMPGAKVHFGQLKYHSVKAAWMSKSLRVDFGPGLPSSLRPFFDSALTWKAKLLHVSDLFYFKKVSPTKAGGRWCFSLGWQISKLSLFVSVPSFPNCFSAGNF